MIQLILKSQNGAITNVYNGLDEISNLFNDTSVKTFSNIAQLAIDLMHNYFHTEINGVKYYHSNAYFDCNGVSIFTFTQL